MVRNNHASADAAHLIGAPDCGQTSFWAHGVRAEAPQNEFGPFLRGKVSLLADFEMGSCNSRARIGESRFELL